MEKTGKMLFLQVKLLAGEIVFFTSDNKNCTEKLNLVSIIAKLVIKIAKSADKILFQ